MLGGRQTSGHQDASALTEQTPQDSAPFRATIRLVYEVTRHRGGLLLRRDGRHDGLMLGGGWLPLGRGAGPLDAPC